MSRKLKIFIIGTDGTGKTLIVKHLQKLLDKNNDVSVFDEDIERELLTDDLGMIEGAQIDIVSSPMIKAIMNGQTGIVENDFQVPKRVVDNGRGLIRNQLKGDQSLNSHLSFETKKP